MVTMSAAHGDPCPHRYCGTHVQGRPDTPNDRVGGLLLHLQVVHYPGRTLEELEARLPELRRAHEIRWGVTPAT